MTTGNGVFSPQFPPRKGNCFLSDSITTCSINPVQLEKSAHPLSRLENEFAVGLFVVSSVEVTDDEAESAAVFDAPPRHSELLRRVREITADRVAVVISRVTQVTVGFDGDDRGHHRCCSEERRPHVRHNGDGHVVIAQR
jgi:hypothetical protein